MGIGFTGVLVQYLSFSLPCLFGAIAVGIGAFWARTAAAVGIIIFVGLFLGFFRSAPLYQSLSAYDVFIGRTVAIRGIVSEDVSFGDNGGQNIQLKDVRINNQRMSGKVWVSTASKQTIKRSDMLVVRGKMSAGFGIMPAAMYRAELVAVHSSVSSDVGRSARDWFAVKIRQAVAEPEASLGIGYLVGQRSLLPPDINEAMRILGLTHVVVASGYNLTILVRFTRRLFARMSKYLAFISAIIMVIGFVAMTGASPSMTRAALVTGVSLGVWYLGRNIQPLVLLGLVGAITATINPFYVWGDLGWYLSMLSFVGIMVISPLIRAYFFGANAQLSLLPSILIETMSAQIATFPLIAYVFGQYSLLALPANMLILPLVPFAMAATFIAGVLAVVFPVAATLAHWPATLVLSYMTDVVRYLAALPNASSELSFSLFWLVFGYIFMLIWCLILWKKTAYNFGRENIIK